MMNVLIVEDEIKTAQLLKELIESKPDFIVVSVQDSIEGTVSYLNRNKEKIDLLFLDIQLADGLSFEIFNQLQINIPIVFCTAYDKYMLKALKNNGVDYVLKPFEDQDIFNSLEKIKRLKSSFSKDTSNPLGNVQALLREQKFFQKSIIAHVGEKMIPVAVDTIMLFHLEYETVNIYCSNNKKYHVFKRLDEIQSILDDKQFFRINRQMIINRDAVREIVPYFNRKVIVKTAFPIPEKAVVSRLKVTSFLSWLEKPI
jgi:DNA-binding LytR/AlgR family response regulator